MRCLTPPPCVVGDAQRMLSAVTAPTQQALDQLRDPQTFKWYIVFVFVLLIWIYSGYFQRRQWPALAAGLAVWLADWINELLNSLFLAANGTAPLWAETGPTAYQPLVGLNVETSALFLLFGLIYANTLPADRHRRLLGLPNRLTIALIMSLVSLLVELVLNDLDALRWHWAFWDVPWGLPLILVFGYLWFFLAAAKAHDAESERERWRFIGLLAVVGLALGVAGAIGGWV